MGQFTSVFFFFSSSFFWFSSFEYNPTTLLLLLDFPSFFSSSPLFHSRRVCLSPQFCCSLAVCVCAPFYYFPPHFLPVAATPYDRVFIGICQSAPRRWRSHTLFGERLFYLLLPCLPEEVNWKLFIELGFSPSLIRIFSYSIIDVGVLTIDNKVASTGVHLHLLKIWLNDYLFVVCPLPLIHESSPHRI